VLDPGDQAADAPVTLDDTESPRRGPPLRCARCGREIADPRDVFAMHAGGALGAFVNPHGYLHEVVTVRRACGLVRIGEPTLEATWFPGFAWTLALCGACGAHVGWHFSGEGSFWGLRRPAITGA